jgi:hypothetical protein
MKYKWLQKNGHPTLLVFFNGWGMNESVIRHISFSGDILMLYRYSTCRLPIEEDKWFQQYEKINLVGWSFGVWMMVKSIRDIRKFHQIVAINGTYYPVHPRWGIHPMIFHKTREHLTPSAFRSFCRNMFTSENEYARFLKIFQPDDFNEIQNELEWFAHVFEKNQLNEVPWIPHKIIMSSKDKIIPFQSQKRSWQDQGKCRIIDTGHYPFFYFTGWEEILGD